MLKKSLSTVCAVFLLLGSLCSMQSGVSVCQPQAAKAGKIYLFSGTKYQPLRNPKIYKDLHFNFRVAYPANWKATVEQYWSATASREGSPDGGIDIYVESNPKNEIRVFGQWGSTENIIQLERYTYTEKFTTASGTAGTLYWAKTGNSVKAAFQIDGNHIAQIKLSNSIFARNEKNIYALLKSISLTKK